MSSIFSPNFHTLSYTVRNKVSVGCLWATTWKIYSCKAKGALEFPRFYFIGKDIETAIIKTRRLKKIKSFGYWKKGYFSVFKKNKGLNGFKSPQKAINGYKGSSTNLKVSLPGLDMAWCFHTCVSWERQERLCEVTTQCRLLRRSFHNVIWLLKS